MSGIKILPVIPEMHEPESVHVIRASKLEIFYLLKAMIPTLKEENQDVLLRRNYAVIAMSIFKNDPEVLNILQGPF